MYIYIYMLVDGHRMDIDYDKHQTEVDRCWLQRSTTMAVEDYDGWRLQQLATWGMRHCRALHIRELYNNSKWQHDDHGIIERPWALQQWRTVTWHCRAIRVHELCSDNVQKIFFFLLLLLHLALAASRVFKASSTSSCVFVRERKEKRERDTHTQKQRQIDIDKDKERQRQKETEAERHKTQRQKDKNRDRKTKIETER